MPAEEGNILHASQALLQRLRPGDLDATLQSITQAAVEVLPQVQFSSITMRHRDGTLDSYALTADLLRELDERQFELKEGPCYQATTDEAYTVANNLAADERYPNYGPTAVQ